MAYKIKDIYPSQTTTGDAGWPDGKPRNIQGGVQGTGTPFEEKLFQDYEGSRQALFDEAGIEPSGQADRVGQSDFVDALQGFQKPASSITDENGGTVQDHINANRGAEYLKQLGTVGNLEDGQRFDVNGYYEGTLVGGGQFVWDASRSKADHNGGTVIAPEALAAWDGSQSDIETILDWTGTGSGCFVSSSKTFTPQQFGATGQLDDTGAFIAWMTCERPLWGSGSVLLQSLVIIEDKNIDLVGYDVDFYLIDDYTDTEQQTNLVVIRNNPSQTLTVSSIEKDVILGGGSTIRLSNSTRINFNTGHPFIEGDVVKIFANDLITPTAPNQRVSEMGRVVEVSPNSVVINASLNFDYIQNPRCVALDRTRKLTLNFKSKTLQPNNNYVKNIFHIAGYVEPVINAECDSARGKFIFSSSNFGATGTVKPRNLTDNASNAQFGYGVGDYGSAYSTWNIVSADTFRHAYTTGATENSEDYFDALAYGGATFCTINNMTATAGTNASADTHEDSLRTTFKNVTVNNPTRGGGVQLRGDKDVVENISFTGSGRVIYGSVESREATIKNVTADIYGGGFFYGVENNNNMDFTVANADITTHNDQTPLIQVQAGNTLRLGSLRLRYARDYRLVNGFSSEVIKMIGGSLSAELIDIDLTSLEGTPAYTSQIFRLQTEESRVNVDRLRVRFGVDSLNYVSLLVRNLNGDTLTNNLSIKNLELIPDTGVDISALEITETPLSLDRIILGNKAWQLVSFQSFSIDTALWFTHNKSKDYINGNDNITALVERTSTGSDIVEIMPPASVGQRVLIRNNGTGTMNFGSGVFSNTTAPSIAPNGALEIYATSDTTWTYI